jgi:diacylglycerol kinase (ATP)
LTVQGKSMKGVINVIDKLIKSATYSMSGLYVLWYKEQSFRLEVYISVIALPIIFLFSIPAVLKLTLILLLLLLLLVETINSSIEAIVDRISLEKNRRSKAAKDMGSTAVLIAIVMNVVAWGFAVYHVLVPLR